MRPTLPVRRNRDMLRSLMTDISQARNVLVNSPQSVSGYVRAPMGVLFRYFGI